MILPRLVLTLIVLLGSFCAPAPRRPGFKVVVLGFDGVDPDLVDRWIEELPTIRRLGEQGTLSTLGTTNPPESPVAWASFATGLNPGRHGIFDFLRRDPATYMPDIGLVKVEKPRFLFKTIPIRGAPIDQQPQGRPLLGATGPGRHRHRQSPASPGVPGASSGSRDHTFGAGCARRSGNLGHLLLFFHGRQPLGSAGYGVRRPGDPPGRGRRPFSSADRRTRRPQRGRTGSADDPAVRGVGPPVDYRDAQAPGSGRGDRRGTVERLVPLRLLRGAPGQDPRNQPLLRAGDVSPK